MTGTPGSSAALAMTPSTGRIGWDDLSTAVRAAIENHAGKVHRAETISSGLNAAFTARLDTDAGPIFAKGVPSARATAQHREAVINPHARPIAPRLHWHVDTAGWHVLGFEHLDGHPADLSPRSPDLPAVARTLARLAELTPPPTGCRRIEHRWSDAAEQSGTDPTLLAGEHLSHTDLNPHNILITGHGARLVDWSWPTLGAPWIDTACATLWLIAEGHTPADAESWAAGNPTWANATPPALDAFTAINAALWAQIAAVDPRPWKQRLHAAASSWAQYRAGS